MNGEVILGIATFVAAILAGGAGWLWWAAAKLNSIDWHLRSLDEKFADATQSHKEATSRLNNHEIRIIRLEQSVIE